ncbi:class I SAM-dependent methyltransferase [Rhizobium herbae]|uniref:SAM-dependent methyltransferase n=1 Tax=Rhizobium herbae TaxID=508661 RepID=A0ABS4EQI3_9HYPH|nr:class I SAM-dependent methyltransferase [Rhizobium herbae]MBP1860200.1 SAM-dependent methyltransferase [Rhizobium herbae]
MPIEKQPVTNAILSIIVDFAGLFGDVLLKSKLKKLAKRLSRDPLNSALSEFVRLIPSGSRVLNIGAGGEVMDVILANVKTGVEVVSSDVDPARKPDVVDDLTATKLPAKSFDFVICAEVIEHVINPYAAAENIRHVLKEGGMAFVSAPFFFPLHDEPYDFFRYTEFGLRKLFQHCSSINIRARASWGRTAMHLLVRSLWFKDKRIDLAVQLLFVWNLPILLILRPILGRTKTPYFTTGFICVLTK